MSSSRYQVVLSVVPRISGSLSVVGSGCIIRSVVRDRRKRSDVKHRLLLGMSCCDLVASVLAVLSTWPMPRGYPGAYGAVGTPNTCVMQGFILQMFALPVPIYNAGLAVYYLLVVRYVWQESRLRGRAAPWMHAVPLTMGVGTAVACLPLALINPDPIGVFCHISPYPLDCAQSFKSRGGDGGEGDCIRGDNADLYRMAFFSVIVLLCLTVASASMILMHRSVLKLERAVEPYRHDSAGSSPSSSSRRRSRQVARQALLFLLAFWTTWLSSLIRNVVRLVGDFDGAVSFGLAFVQLAMVPLQGFLNALVYFRPLERWGEYRADVRSLVSWSRRMASSSVLRFREGYLTELR